MSINSGFIVLTSSGKKGKVYVNKPKINGKVVVFLLDENENEMEDKFVICKQEKLKVIGFID